MQLEQSVTPLRFSCSEQADQRVRQNSNRVGEKHPLQLVLGKQCMSVRQISALICADFQVEFIPFPGGTVSDIVQKY